ncbi:MAG: GAF domain-containing sensor histidine kinase [Solirubrobacteraceae bacterium]
MRSQPPIRGQDDHHGNGAHTLNIDRSTRSPDTPTRESRDSVHQLLDVGRALTTELDQRKVLDRVLATAREVTGARYAAVGILNEQKTELAQFLTAGIDEQTHRAIGELPHGRGVLGALIERPQPLRLSDVGQHPSSYGFPLGHPMMHSFLGVPVVIHGEVWGNLYLTEKDGGEFTAADEEAVVTLSQWTAIAIENARLYETSERRRVQAEKAAHGLEATRDVAVAIGGEISLEHVLELIAKRGRALVGARSLVIMLCEGEELVVHASAGHVQDVHGTRLPIADSTFGQVLAQQRSERITDVASRLRITPSQFGVSDPHTSLLVPMAYRGKAVGVLAAFDRGKGSEAFDDDDEQMLRTFAASAATAVALAQSVAADRLRSSLASAEDERRRWARELHDETLQGLAALRMLVSAALRRGDPEQHEQTMRTVIEHIEREIENLRAIITELRPAALDELGLKIALETLLDRHREQSGLEINSEIMLPDHGKDQPRLDPDLESTIYRLVQEALTNVAKHAGASTVRVEVSQPGAHLQIEVQDNGCGFDPDTTRPGFGLEGMRERVGLAGGTLSISANQHGTRLRACLPTKANASALAHQVAARA